MVQEDLDAVKREAKSLLRLDRTTGVSHMEVVRHVASLCTAIALAERSGRRPDEIRPLLGPARELHARSEFIRRLQEWPRGYAGDFETIDMLLDAPISTRPGSVAYHLERYAFDCAAAQQHRNKVVWQARAILDVALEKREAGRVLVLACGGGRDVLQVLPLLRAVGCPRIVLNDADPEALAVACHRLRGIQGQLSVLEGHVISAIRSVDQQYDLVVAGGLMDYLTTRQAKFLVRHVRNRVLRRGGRFRFTNIAEGNPFRCWISYLADWHLRERSSEELLALTRGDGNLSSDRTRLSLLMEVGPVTAGVSYQSRLKERGSSESVRVCGEA